MKRSVAYNLALRQPDRFAEVDDMVLPFYPYIYPSGGYTMPDKYKEAILDRTAYTRNRLDMFEHWTASGCENIFQMVIYPSGHIALDRVDDWWADDHGFIPKYWEST